MRVYFFVKCTHRLSKQNCNSLAGVDTKLAKFHSVADIIFTTCFVTFFLKKKYCLNCDSFSPWDMTFLSFLNIILYLHRTGDSISARLTKSVPVKYHLMPSFSISKHMRVRSENEYLEKSDDRYQLVKEWWGSEGELI